MWCTRLDRDKKEATTMNTYAIDSGCNTTVHITTTADRASGSGVFDTAENLAEPIGADCKQPAGFWNGPTGAKQLYHYTLFNKSPTQLRLLGARGGRAYGRNLRARRALMPTQPVAAPPRATLAQSTAAAVAVLDAQFPWLSGAEQRRSRNQPSRRLPAHSPHCVKRSE
jgi:hypothetical protein